MFDKCEFRKEITPKRVYSLLKLIEYKNGVYTKEEVFKIIQPETLNKNTSEIARVYNFCIVESMLSVDINGKIIINIDSKAISNEKEFRKFINNKLRNSDENNGFLLISKKVLEATSEIYEVSNFSNIAEYLKSSKITEEMVLGWRFWASFLGYGFVMNSQFVINPHIKLQDLIEKNFEDKNNLEIKLSDFFKTICESAPDFKGCIINNEVNSNLTIGLKTLENLEDIKLIRVADSEENYNFFDGRNTVIYTHISIKGGE